MPLANYTTKVPVSDSIAEVQKLLADFGAASVSMHYEGGKVVGIDFGIKLDGHPLQFRLPVNVAAAQRALTAAKVKSYHKTPTHAEMVAWRILKDWVRIQLTLVEMRQAELAQVFLPYAVDGNGETVYQGFRIGRAKQLGSGGA